MFVDGLREFPVDTVANVCGDLGRISPDEFEPRFPPLYRIRELCFREVEAQNLRRLQLNAPKLTPFKQADPERLAQFLEDVKAEVRRKSMR